MSKKCTTKRYYAEIRLANGHFFRLLLIYGHICATTLSTFSTCQSRTKFVLCSCSIFNMVLHTCVKMALGIWHSIPFSHGFILNCVKKWNQHTPFCFIQFLYIHIWMCAPEKKVREHEQSKETHELKSKSGPRNSSIFTVCCSLSLWRSPLYSGSSSFPHLFYS